jgi:hypothetical protein
MPCKEYRRRARARVILSYRMRREFAVMTNRSCKRNRIISVGQYRGPQPLVERLSEPAEPK